MASNQFTEPPTGASSSQVLVRRGRGRRSNNQAAKSTSKNNNREHPMIRFINTTHPDDTTSAHSLSLIRSHVARHSRAARQERKLQSHQVIMFPPSATPETTLISSEEEYHSGDDQATASQRLPWKRAGGLRLLAPKQASWSRSTSTDSQRQWEFNPIQLIGGARKDSSQGFARALSDDEQYLFDYYLNYVILNGYSSCYHKESDKEFQDSMRDLWVPYAMTQPSLMAAIFHVACRNYAATTNNDRTHRFAIQKLQYRLTCLSMAKDAIASQEVADDTTISLALILASESFFEGDISAYLTHCSGIIKMVTARGGLNMLGLSGFLTKSIAWSVYTPTNQLVLGPEEAELINYN